MEGVNIAIGKRGEIVFLFGMEMMFVILWSVEDEKLIYSKLGIYC